MNSQNIKKKLNSTTPYWPSSTLCLIPFVLGLVQIRGIEEGSQVTFTWPGRGRAPEIWFPGEAWRENKGNNDKVRDATGSCWLAQKKQRKTAIRHHQRDGVKEGCWHITLSDSKYYFHEFSRCTKNGLALNSLDFKWRVERASICVCSTVFDSRFYVP